MMWRGFVVMLLCVCPLLAVANEVSVGGVDHVGSTDALRAYEGRWVGHFTIHSTATGYTESFPVEQQYWWKNDTLHGVAVTQREVGMSSARSQSIVKKGKYFSEVKTGDTVENYWGVHLDGGIVWFSSNLKRTQDYQMKETIVEVNGERVLQTEGFDTYVYGEGIAHLVYRGEMKFVK